ncbi:hypothetical protein BDR05DRAFT_962457 [Suillus weaverae]|nr:hypothetical protein BDR05DRAFT_962457 [Suillus weaverae]
MTDSFDDLESLFLPDSTMPFETSLTFHPAESVLVEYEHSYNSGSGYFCSIA